MRTVKENASYFEILWKAYLWSLMISKWTGNLRYNYTTSITLQESYCSPNLTTYSTYVYGLLNNTFCTLYSERVSLVKVLRISIPMNAHTNVAVSLVNAFSQGWKPSPAPWFWMTATKQREHDERGTHCLVNCNRKLPQRWTPRIAEGPKSVEVVEAFHFREIYESQFWCYSHLKKFVHVFAFVQ